MSRSRSQNDALAAQCAVIFRSLLPPVASVAAIPDATVKLFDFALTHLARTELWDLYLQVRVARDQALLLFYDEWLKTPGNAPDAAPQPHDPIIPRELRLRYFAHAFLARAAIAPASALKGRATDSILGYVKEGLEYASRVLALDNETRRLQLLELWLGGVANFGNLDTRQEGLYVPRDA